MKVYYDIVNKNIGANIEDSIGPLRKNTPDWWKELSVFQNGAKTIKEFWNSFNWDIFSTAEIFTTVKVCPGMKAHFDNSMLLKFPCDIFLETNAEGGYRFKSSNKELSVSSHHYDQAPAIGDRYIIMKFVVNFSLMTSKKSQMSFVDPIMFKDQPYRSSPGCVYCDESPVIPNLICFFPKENATYYFKAGDPMAIIQFSDPIDSVTRKDHSEFHKKRNSGVKSFFLHSKK